MYRRRGGIVSSMEKNIKKHLVEAVHKCPWLLTYANYKRNYAYIKHDIPTTSAYPPPVDDSYLLLYLCNRLGYERVIIYLFNLSPYAKPSCDIFPRGDIPKNRCPR
jgi:hypothetical protein